MAKPVLLEHPNLCPGAYSLDCYCKYENERHSWDEFPHQFVGKNEADCKRQAKLRGWTLHKDNSATCRKCKEDLANGYEHQDQAS